MSIVLGWEIGHENKAIRVLFSGPSSSPPRPGCGRQKTTKSPTARRTFISGHISYIEPTPGGTDPVVLREGGAAPEPGVLNLPIGPGDTIRTSADRLCEIQFDTGTVVRLDVETEVRIETILARSLSSPEELSVLTLGKGRVYVMYKEYDRKEMFQVLLTPNAAVKMRPNSVAMLTAAADGTTEAQVNNGRVQVLFGPSEKGLDDRAVRKGERLIVLADHQFQQAAAITGTAFELWNLEVNAHFDELHAGLTALPKPIQKLPGAVFYFAQTYGNHYGEWLWDELYGYVWRPYIDNGAYPWGWSPYYLRPLVLLRRADVLGASGALGLDPVSPRHLAVGQETRLGLAARFAVCSRLGRLGFLLRICLLAAVVALRLDVR